MVEHNLAKVRVASSSLVFRSNPDKQSGFIVKKSLGGGMVDTRDLKSRGHYVRAGSSPAQGTIIAVLKMKTIQGSYKNSGINNSRIRYFNK